MSGRRAVPAIGRRPLSLRAMKAVLVRAMTFRDALPHADVDALVRAASESAKQVKSMDIMDVAPAAIDAAFRTHAVTTLIHGHTHRPATHRHTLDGAVRTRHVLPDWDFDGAGAPRGGSLRWTGADWTAGALSADGTASAVSH